MDGSSTDLYYIYSHLPGIVIMLPFFGRVIVRNSHPDVDMIILAHMSGLSSPLLQSCPREYKSSILGLALHTPNAVIGEPETVQGLVGMLSPSVFIVAPIEEGSIGVSLEAKVDRRTRAFLPWCLEIHRHQDSSEIDVSCTDFSERVRHVGWMTGCTFIVNFHKEVPMSPKPAPV